MKGKYVLIIYYFWYFVCSILLFYCMIYIIWLIDDIYIYIYNIFTLKHLKLLSNLHLNVVHYYRQLYTNFVKMYNYII